MFGPNSVQYHQSWSEFGTTATVSKRKPIIPATEVIPMTNSVFPNLSAEMRRFGVEERDVAVTLGKSDKTVRNYLSGRTPIKQSQCVAIRDTHFSGMTTDYLFSSEPVVVSD